MKTRSETISFRADLDLTKMIDDACARFGISRGSWVRGVVIAHLHEHEDRAESLELTPILERLHALENRCESLKGDTARSLFVVLTMIGNVPKDEAKELVRSKFLERGD